MDNHSAEVTSSGRSFNVHGPTTGKARLVGDGCQLNRRHCQTVGASRTERSAARQVSDMVESMQDCADHNGNLALNSLQPSSYSQLELQQYWYWAQTDQYSPLLGTWRYFYWLSYPILILLRHLGANTHGDFDSHSMGRLVMYTCIFCWKMNSVSFCIGISIIPVGIAIGRSQ